VTGEKKSREAFAASDERSSTSGPRKIVALGDEAANGMRGLGGGEPLGPVAAKRCLHCDFLLLSSGIRVGMEFWRLP
jgi:hypothetical protein